MAAPETVQAASVLRAPSQAPAAAGPLPPVHSGGGRGGSVAGTLPPRPPTLPRRASALLLLLPSAFAGYLAYWQARAES